MNKSAAIKTLFEPESFAVVGASSVPGKIGHTIVKNLVDGGYKGIIYPINPKGGKILGLDALRGIGEIKGGVDAASLVIPASGCAEAALECAEAGVKNLQIISSGFSETGNSALENRIAAIGRQYGMRILGPNIFGMYSSAVSMNSTFSATAISPGRVAILTQSGALGIAMIGKTAVECMGLSAIVSLGNKCDIDEADLLEYLIDQEQTGVILMYIEGIKNGSRLIPVIKRAVRAKPVIVIKSGKSKRGAMAAASHTGSLAGSDNIFDSIMKQCGVIRASSLEEGFNWCKYLSAAPEPRGPKSVIVTNGGGIGVLATDSCEENGIELYDDQAVLSEIFGAVVPDYGSTKNPVDITGGAMAGDYDLALRAPSKSGEIDSTIALYCETATFDSANLVPMIRETYKSHVDAGKPIVYAIVGGRSIEESIKALRSENIPVYSDVSPAVSALGKLYGYYRLKNRPEGETEDAGIDVLRIGKTVKGALEAGRTFLLANEGREVMQAAGIECPASAVASSLPGAVKSAEAIGYPVVMKVVSRDIIHKSDAGGIALNINGRKEVIDAYEAIIDNCRRHKADARIEGIEIAEMAKPGLEFVAGAVRDPSFGPVVMCGLGGIYVEVMKDVSFRSYPLPRSEVLDMIKGVRSYPLLLGVRGESKKDIQAVADVIQKVGAILHSCELISDIEINPLTVYPQGEGVKALDIRILLRKL